jgi:hypothetical protein
MKMRMPKSPLSKHLTNVQHAAHNSLKQNILKKGRFRVKPCGSVGDHGRPTGEFKIHTPQTLRNLERKSCKTVFLGSHLTCSNFLSPLVHKIRSNFARSRRSARLRFGRITGNGGCRRERGRILRSQILPPRCFTA